MRSTSTSLFCAFAVIFSILQGVCVCVANRFRLMSFLATPLHTMRNRLAGTRACPLFSGLSYGIRTQSGCLSQQAVLADLERMYDDGYSTSVRTFGASDCRTAQMVMAAATQLAPRKRVTALLGVWLSGNSAQNNGEIGTCLLSQSHP
jgi:hypothetical protein